MKYQLEYPEPQLRTGELRQNQTNLYTVWKGRALSDDLDALKGIKGKQERIIDRATLDVVVRPEV